MGRVVVWWRSHVGWFLSRDSQVTEWKLITNLSKYPDLRFLDRYYSLPPAILAGAVFLLGVAFFVGPMLLFAAEKIGHKTVD